MHRISDKNHKSLGASHAAIQRESSTIAGDGHDVGGLSRSITRESYCWTQVTAKLGKAGSTYRMLVAHTMAPLLRSARVCRHAGLA